MLLVVVLLIFLPIDNGCFSKDLRFHTQHLIGSRENLKTPTAEHCQKQCQERSDCNHFSWFSPDNYFFSVTGDIRLMQSCFLRTSNERPTYDVGVFSGPAFCVKSNATTAVEGTNLCLDSVLKLIRIVLRKYAATGDNRNKCRGRGDSQTGSAEP